MGDPLFRVVEEPEHEALLANDGVPTSSPTGQERKPFWQTLDDAILYQGKVPTRWGITRIWMFPNPHRVGRATPSRRPW